MELSPGVTAAAVSGLLIVVSVVILLACARSKKKKNDRQRRLPQFTERPDISGPLPANATSLAQAPSSPSSSQQWTTSATATAMACVINHATSTSVPLSVQGQTTSLENKTKEHDDDDSIIYDLMPIPKTFGLVAAGQEEHNVEVHHEETCLNYGASIVSSISSASGQISPEPSLQLSSYSQFSCHSSVQSPTSPVSGQFFIGSQNSGSLSSRQFFESQNSGLTSSAMSSEIRKTESQNHNERLWHCQGSGHISMPQTRSTHLPHSHSTGQLLPTTSLATHLPHSNSSGQLSSQANSYFHNPATGHEDIPLNYDPYYEDDEPIYDFISYDRESVSEDTREMSDGPCYLYTRSDSGVCSDVPRSEFSGHTVIPTDYEDQSDDAAYDPVYVRHDVIDETKNGIGQTDRQVQDQSSKQMQPLRMYGQIQSQSTNQSTIQTQISDKNHNQAQSRDQIPPQSSIQSKNQLQNQNQIHTQNKTENQDQNLNLDQNHGHQGAYVDCMSSPERFVGLKDAAERVAQRARSRADKTFRESVSERPSTLAFAFPDNVPHGSPLQSPMSDGSGDVFTDEEQHPKTCDNNAPVQPKIMTKNGGGHVSSKPPVYGVAAKFRRDAVSSKDSVVLRRSASWVKQTSPPQTEAEPSQKHVSLPNRPPISPTTASSKPSEAASGKQNNTPRVHKQPVRSNSVFGRKESFHEELTKALSRRASVSAGLGSKQTQEACGSEIKQAGPKKEILRAVSFKVSKPPVPPKPLVRRNTSWVQENVG